MNHSPLANVDTIETGARIQRRNRSFLTSDRAAAGMQPKTSARGAVCAGPSRASAACHRDR